MRIVCLAFEPFDDAKIHVQPAVLQMCGNFQQTR